MAEKILISDEPVDVALNVWYYETEEGIEITRLHQFPAHGDVPAKEFEGHVLISWNMLRESLERYKQYEAVKALRRGIWK